MIGRKKHTIFGYSFEDQSLYELAVTHRSVSALNNERLEFLGDALLGFVIAAEITKKFPEATEGDLTRIRASLVNGENLAGIANHYQIGDLILLGEGEKKTGGHRRPSILADVFESLLGAIYLDSDFYTVRNILISIFQPAIGKVESAKINKDAKTILQEHLQSMGFALPEYLILEVSGPEHRKEFTVECKTDLALENQTASGNSKRKAEQAAANQTIIKIGLS